MSSKSGPFVTLLGCRFAYCFFVYLVGPVALSCFVTMLLYVLLSEPTDLNAECLSVL